MKADIVQLLKDGVTVRLKPQGYSMYPLFIPDRDEAVIAPADPARLRRNDVVLYRRPGSVLVLHRIWRVREDGFYMNGDNQTETEGPISPDLVFGILVAVVRNGRTISVRNPLYRVITRFWLLLRPVRPYLCVPLAKLKRLLRRNS